MKNMKFKDNILGILCGNTVVHCNTKEKADAIINNILIKFLSDCDVDIIDRLRNSWSHYKADTCYYCYYVKHSIFVTYGVYRYFKEHNYKILEFEDLLEPIEKIDCSNTVNFIKEYTRMCGTIECVDCKLDSIIGDYENESDEVFTCTDFIKKHPDIAVDIVQEWSDKNPKYKTYIDDFREKFPNATIFNDNIMRHLCRKKMYPDGNIPQDCGMRSFKLCKKCWETKIKEE